MELHRLKPAPGAIKNSKRIGRGQGSGKGGTATRGHKGAQSRAGYKTKQGGEGGQNPLYRALPKFSPLKPKKNGPVAINIARIIAHAQKHAVDQIDFALMVQAGWVSKDRKVKIIGNMVPSTKLTVSAHLFSKGAKAVIEEKGGTATLL